MSPKHLTALPVVYYAIFRYYEPLLGIGGLLSVLGDPHGAYVLQAPWPNDAIPRETPPAARVVILQLACASWLMTTLNYFILGAAKHHLDHDPALQERVVSAYLHALFFGDMSHMVLCLWSWGPYRWEFHRWTPLMKATLGLGATLLVPRVFWYLGVGRYVHRRDGAKVAKNEKH